MTKPSHPVPTVMPMVPPMMSPPMVGAMPPPPATPHSGFQSQFGARASPSPSPPFSGAYAPPPSEVSSDISSPPSTRIPPTPVAAQVPIFGTGDKFNRSGASTPNRSPWNPNSSSVAAPAAASPYPPQLPPQQLPLFSGLEMMAPMPPPNFPIPDPAVLAGMPIPPTAPPAISAAHPIPNFSNLSFTSDKDQLHLS